MKKLLVIIAVAIMLVATSGIAFADDSGPMGPAPDYGDCSSNDDCPQYGPYASDEGYGPGPAPNSHDGIPDGPGW